MTEDKKRGGAREGAGRPRVKELRKTRCFRLNEEEYAAMKKFLTKYRQEERQLMGKIGN